MIVAVHKAVVPISQRLFSEERSFWLLATWVLGTVAFFKGIRFPNQWSATQAQVDYRHGFVKRGLFGTLFTDHLHLNHYHYFVVFSFVVLAIALALLLLLVSRSRILSRVGDGELVALFFSSLAFTYLANLNGYSDILLLATTLIMLLIRRPKLRLVLALFLCPAALLIHSVFLLLFLPAVLFSFFADTVEQRIRPRTAALAAGVLALLCLGVTFRVSFHQSVSQAQALALEHEVASRVDFQVRPDFFDVMCRSFKNNVTVMYRTFRIAKYRATEFSAAITFLPVFGLILLAGRKVCNSSANPLVKRFGFILLLCMAIAPVPTHALGWDCGRWDAFSCISAFLGVILLIRALPQHKFVIGPAFRNACILVIALNMASGEVLLDVAQPRPYPFVQDARTFYSHLRESLGPPPHNQ